MIMNSMFGSSGGEESVTGFETLHYSTLSADAPIDDHALTTNFYDYTIAFSRSIKISEISELIFCITPRSPSYTGGICMSATNYSGMYMTYLRNSSEATQTLTKFYPAFTGLHTTMFEGHYRKVEATNGGIYSSTSYLGSDTTLPWASKMTHITELGKFSDPEAIADSLLMVSTISGSYIVSDTIIYVGVR